MMYAKREDDGSDDLKNKSKQSFSNIDEVRENYKESQMLSHHTPGIPGFSAQPSPMNKNMNRHQQSNASTNMFDSKMNESSE